MNFASLVRNNFFVLLSAVYFKAVLDATNVNYMAERFGIFGFKLEISSIRIIESYLLLSIVCLLVNCNTSKLSSLFIWIFIVLTYIPILSIYGLSSIDKYWVYLISVFWILLIVSINMNLKTKQINLLSNVSLRKKKQIRNIVFSSIILYSFLCVLSVGNISFTLKFDEIYDTRSNFLPKLPFAGYLISWATFVVLPFLIVYYRKLKNNRLSLIACIIQVILAGVSGQKIVLLSVPLMYYFGGIKINKSDTLKNICSLNVFLGSILVASYLSYRFFDDLWLSFIFSNRLLTIPAMASYYYYDFFSTHQPCYLSHSLLSGLLHYPYDLLPWFVIGEEYYYKSDLSANAGLIPDAYMNFREYGVVLVFLALYYILKFVDKISIQRDSSLVLGLFMMPLLWSVNTSFFSSFLSAGLLIAIFITFTLPMIPNSN